MVDARGIACRRGEIGPVRIELVAREVEMGAGRPQTMVGTPKVDAVHAEMNGVRANMGARRGYMEWVRV
jgi:hypothetical protein